MGKMALICAAAIAAFSIAAPAAAGSSDGPFTRVTFGSQGNFDGRDNHRRNHHQDDIGIWVNAGEWARYNNRAFESDSYNDWWHDRPDRAYPAWVRNNQNCARQWFAGNTLRC